MLLITFILTALATAGQLMVVPGYLSPLGVVAEKEPFLELLPESIWPEPIEPGGELIVKLRLQNRGGAAARDVIVKFDEGWPFQLKDRTKLSTDIAELCSGCSVQLTYNLAVAANARSGSYTLTFYRVHANSSQKSEFSVRLTARPELELVDVRLNNSKLVPGSAFVLFALVKNVGLGAAKATRITLQLAELPIIPAGDDSSFIGSLEAGESKVIEFPLVLDKNAKTGSYKLPIALSASDEFGAAKFASTEFAGLTVLGQAELSLATVSTDPVTVNEHEPFFLIVRLENTGSGDANSIKLALELPFKGSTEVWLSKLKPDEEKPIVLPLIAAGDGSYVYNLSVSYTDDLGQHTVIFPGQLYVKPKLSSAELALALVLGLVVLIVLLWIRLRKVIPLYLRKLRS